MAKEMNWELWRLQDSNHGHFRCVGIVIVRGASSAFAVSSTNMLTVFLA